MPQREELFYNAYSYGDKLEPGQKMTLEHHISFNPYRADLSSLTEMTLGNLQVMREKSVAEERKIFSELQERAQLWEAQAAQTMVLEICEDPGGEEQWKPLGGHGVRLAQDQQPGLPNDLPHPGGHRL